MEITRIIILKNYSNQNYPIISINLVNYIILKKLLNISNKFLCKQDKYIYLRYNTNKFTIHCLICTKIIYSLINLKESRFLCKFIL